jgi:hypothetical protein
MRLGLFRVPNKKLAISDERMSVGEISIWLQRMFASGDTLGGALGPYIDKSRRDRPRETLRLRPRKSPRIQ